MNQSRKWIFTARVGVPVRLVVGTIDCLSDVSSNLSKPYSFLKQKTLALLLSTGGYQEQNRAWFEQNNLSYNQTKTHWYKLY